MVSSSRRKISADSPFPVGAPSFCKIVLERVLREGRFQLPMSAMMRYRRLLTSSSILNLKVPDGRVWPIELTICNEGKVWLQKGWQEFANFHSINFGYLLVFSYEGQDSFFQVRIFGKNSLEIKYPFTSSHDENPNEGGETGGMPTAVVRSSNFRASSFRSHRPFFATKMQLSYIIEHQLKIPTTFARQYIGDTGTWDFDLHLSNGRTWPVKCHVKPYTRGSKEYRDPRISNGWKTFVEDNHLTVGDYCVFELIDRLRHRIIFKVHIFRAEVGN